MITNLSDLILHLNNNYTNIKLLNIIERDNKYFLYLFKSSRDNTIHISKELALYIDKNKLITKMKTFQLTELINIQTNQRNKKLDKIV